MIYLNRLSIACILLYSTNKSFSNLTGAVKLHVPTDTHPIELTKYDNQGEQEIKERIHLLNLAQLEPLLNFDLFKDSLPENSMPITLFLSGTLGVIVMSFALSFIIINERKAIRAFWVISEAKKYMLCNSSIDEVRDGNNYRLIHCTGKTSTQVQTSDSMFGV